MSCRTHWIQPKPRLETIPTRDLYQQFLRLFPAPDGLALEPICKNLMSVTFDIWAIDNHFKDPFSIHYPPDYEPVVKMEGWRNPSTVERIIDSAMWSDINLINLLSENNVQDYKLRGLIQTLVDRFEQLYPPTGYDSLIDIRMDVRDWMLSDMLIHIR